MEIKVPYGKTGQKLSVPDANLSGILQPKEYAAKDAPEKLIKEALQNPAGTKKLADLIKSKEKIESVAIVVDDHTRPCRTDLMLPPLLEELRLAGIKDEQILIIFATGSHRTTKKEEAEKLLGKEVADRIKYISNDAWGDDFVNAGTTKRGTDIWVKKAYMDADLKILTGDVEIHYFAGYGGGRKSILPGVARYDTIQANYKRNFFEPDSRPAKLDGNPMYENMTEAARLAGVDFTLNVVQREDEVVGAFAGDFDSVLKSGAALVEKIYMVKAKEKADIVVAAANGAPHDIDLYQAYKALHLALAVTKEGGTIILSAECPEGPGNKNYEAWMKKYKTKEEMRAELDREFNIGGHKAYYNLLAVERFEIYLVSSMPKEEVEGLYRFRHATGVQEAFDAAMKKHGTNARVLVIPEGSTTVSGV